MSVLQIRKIIFQSKCQNMGDEEEKREQAEAEKDFINYLEKSKEKEIRVCKSSFDLNNSQNYHEQTGNSGWTD